MTEIYTNYVNYTTSTPTAMVNTTVAIDAETKSVMDVYYEIELASAVILLVLSAVTVPTNILLLSSIWRDPLKCFNKPTTPLIIGLAVADLLTGLTTEPFFAAYYIERYMKSRVGLSESVMVMYRTGQFLSTVAISSSFLIVLALSWSQCVAVRFPHHYKTWITKKKVLACVIGIWLYFLIFSLLHFANIDQMLFLKVDLALHPTLFSIVLFLILIFLYKSFNEQVRVRKRKLSRSASFGEKTPVRRHADNIERQFTIVTLYLAGILLASALPHVIIQYVFLYCSQGFALRDQFYTFIAMRIRDLLLFVKVALDAFIYAWRLPMYRRALHKTIVSEGLKRRLTTTKHDERTRSSRCRSAEFV